MRAVLFLLFLVASALAGLAEDEIVRFTPLNADERFAYARPNVRVNEVRRRWDLVAYAVRNNDIENASQLFLREDVARVQLTSDLRMVFFLAIERGENPHFWNYNLYMADGNTGEIRRLLTDISPIYRASQDGRFVAVVRGNHRSSFTSVYLLDVESNAMADEFELRAHDTVSVWQGVHRFGSVFRIYGINEGSDIVIFAELDTVAMELRTVWDITGDRWLSGLPDGLAEPPNLSFDEGWRDDAMDHFNDPTVRLQR